MEGSKMMEGVEAFTAPIIDDRKLTSFTSGITSGSYPHATVEAVWPETERIPASREIPQVLNLGRYARTLAAGDFLIVGSSVYIAGEGTSLPLWLLLASTLTAYPAWMFILRLYDARPEERVLAGIRRIALATLLSLASLCTVVGLSGFPVPLVILGKQVFIACLAVSCWRLLYEAASRWRAMKIPILVAGAGSRGMAIYDLLKSPRSPLRVEGFLDDNLRARPRNGSPPVVGTCLDIIKAAAKTGARQVIMAMPRYRDSESLRTIMEARMKGIIVREMTDLYEEMAGRIPVKFIDHNWLISARGFALLYSRRLLVAKRLIDAVLSGLLTIALVPVFLLVVFLIKLDSPGPVLYRQARVGKDGKVFTIFKFRSMRQDAESNGACWAQECDPRITRIGRFLRKFRIDELPQLWNILKGEMSFVGPRPERPEFVATLERQIPHYSVRHVVKPGVTGWAQVILRYGASVDDSQDKLEADLYYIKNMSLLLDLKILMRTVGVVLLSQGAR